MVEAFLNGVHGGLDRGIEEFRNLRTVCVEVWVTISY